MHAAFLQLALAEARKHQGFCAPNPAVGAVAVIAGQVVGAGFHHGPGTAHAEVEALQGLSDEQCRAATLYVSLEPCCHQGRTPPCTELILKRGVRSVVYGFEDPNPVVRGHGREKLSSNGVECLHVSHPEIDAFYDSYRHWWTTGRPRVTAKLALSLDGKIAGPEKARVALTGDSANQFTHQWRKRSDAILTTAQTILIDDPQMNVRLGAETIAKPLFILDRLGRLPWNAKVIRTAADITLFHGIEADECRLEALKESRVKLVRTPTTPQGLDLGFVVDYLGKTAGAHDVWLEAGGTSFSQFVRSGLVDRAFLFVAPRWLGKDATLAFDAPSETLFAEAKQIRWSGLGSDGLAEILWN